MVIIVSCVRMGENVKNLAPTLDSGIDVAPGINVAPPLKNFHITILTLFYINLGIAVIFDFIFFFIFFQRLISVPLRLFRSLE
jgi:hypothetical protein